MFDGNESTDYRLNHAEVWGVKKKNRRFSLKER